MEAAFLEADADPVILPYYNASNPAQSYSGPSNSGTAQNTVRTQRVQLQLKAGAPANTGSQTTPPADAGWIGLYQIAVANGQTTITAGNISVLPTAPFLSWKLPSLKPGFGCGVKTFTSSGTFTVPAGVTQVKSRYGVLARGVSLPFPAWRSGGGSGGGYARKLVTGLSPGQVVPVTVGAGGAAGTTTGTPAGSGGTSSFGQFVSATGGSLNYQATTSAPGNGATPPGIGIGGDVNFSGSAGQAGTSNQGGMGGAAPMGGYAEQWKHREYRHFPRRRRQRRRHGRKQQYGLQRRSRLGRVRGCQMVGSQLTLILQYNIRKRYGLNMSTPATHAWIPSHARVVTIDSFIPVARGTTAVSPPPLNWPTKDPGDILDYVLDIGPAIVGNDGDSIATLDIASTPSDPGDLVIQSSTTDGGRIILWLSEGQAGTVYTLTFDVTTVNGRHCNGVFSFPFFSFSVPQIPAGAILTSTGTMLTDQNGNPVLSGTGAETCKFLLHASISCWTSPVGSPGRPENDFTCPQ